METALGKSKECQEFLVLHYFRTENAFSWDELLAQCFPKVRLQNSVARRANVVRCLKATHIAPSHRRPHMEG